ncbi:MarR family transcriptional regulator [Streptomyces sp. NPDC059874]|uniref:MarR family transcriptional regulator n=1 Tax=Streptomyces sp. NPDC059874 TaxID=3346983 RepID=UPI00365D9920
MSTPAFDPDRDLTCPPLYTLNLSAAQRSVLAWLEDHGALFAHVPAPVEEVGDDCELSVSTVYDALARLETLCLVLREPGGAARINARYYFTLHPEMREMITAALAAPEIVPDDRAQAPRKTGNVAARRRRTIRPVDDD